jgi:release factor glutamine methyltransferase
MDAVVANLPYVADSEWPSLPPDVGDHEPRLALAGGADGLDLVRRLVAQATRVAFLALEVGEGQADAVRALLQGSGMTTEARADLAGIDRVVVGRRP